jgi:hypothetical protein
MRFTVEKAYKKRRYPCLSDLGAGSDDSGETEVGSEEGEESSEEGETSTGVEACWSGSTTGCFSSCRVNKRQIVCCSNSIRFIVNGGNLMRRGRSSRRIVVILVIG